MLPERLDVADIHGHTAFLNEEQVHRVIQSLPCASELRNTQWLIAQLHLVVNWIPKLGNQSWSDDVPLPPWLAEIAFSHYREEGSSVFP